MQVLAHGQSARAPAGGRIHIGWNMIGGMCSRSCTPQTGGGVGWVWGGFTCGDISMTDGVQGAEAEKGTEAIVGEGPLEGFMGGFMGTGCCTLAVETTPEACCSWHVPRADWN